MTLALPSPLAGATACAGTSYGKRSINWTISEPGEWHRNRYSMAWVEVTEREPWKGEPLSLWPTRRPPDATLARESFTEKARAAIQAEVLPIISRYGFSRLWVDLHRVRRTADMDTAVNRAAAELDWHRQQRDLHEMHQAGDIEFVPLAIERGREQRVAVVPRYRGDSSTNAVHARAIVHGEQVGWITDHGDLIPLEDVLR